MEHSCHKCGAMVEDGVPFCKQCGAPQIRVLGIEAGPAATSEHKPDSSESLTPPSLAGSPYLPSPPSAGRPQVTDFRPLPPPPPARAGVVWSRALPSAALAGVFSLLAMVIPYAIFGPAFMMGGALAVMLGGALAVMLYRRSIGGTAPAPGVGAKIGAASGAFGFLFPAVMSIARLVYSPDEVRQNTLQIMSQMVGQGYDPQIVAQVQDLIRTPDGLAFFVGFQLFVVLVVMVAGSSIGGALYAAWVRRRPSR